VGILLSSERETQGAAAAPRNAEFEYAAVIRHASRCGKNEAVRLGSAQK
jgi:hypothetical protein